MTAARLKSQNGDLLVRDGTTDTSIKSGVAKAWADVAYSGGTPITQGTASLNISTYTDIGTGDYQANFTNNMNSSDFAKAGMGVTNVRVLAFSGTLASSYFRGNNWNVATSYQGVSDNGNTFVIHGDLA
jgi:hypothetical protein